MVHMDKGADLSRSAVARYIQLASLFRGRIKSGKWAVGQQIPTVDELAEECGVARATIRQALGLLEAEGLVARFRAKGTFVKDRPQDQLWCEVETDWSGLLRPRQGAKIEVVSSETVTTPGFVPHAIGDLAPSYRHMRRRHSRDGEVFLLADLYVDERLAKRMKKEDFVTKTALKLVVGMDDVKIIEARQTLTIGSADIETARELNIPLNGPVAHVNRTAADSRGRIVMIANGIYRGDVVRVDMRLR